MNADPARTLAGSLKTASTTPLGQVNPAAVAMLVTRIVTDHVDKDTVPAAKFSSSV